MNKATTTPGFLGVYFSFFGWKGFLTIPSCHLLLAELGILRDQGVVLGAKLGLQSAVQEARDKSGLGKGS